jgi:predicted N-acetyltransferase YhbS
LPLREVLTSYRGRGIGTELVRRLLDELGELYAVDLLCDPELVPFYERFGMSRTVGMAIRRPHRTGG